MNTLKKIHHILLSAEKTITIAANLSVAVLVFISVVFRYILQKNFGGLEELIIFIAFWMYFMGGALGSWQDSHISADFLTILPLKERGKQYMVLLRHLLTVIILIMASVCAVRLMIYVIQVPGKTTVLKMPMSVAYLSTVVGILMMTIYSIMHFIRNILDLRAMNKKEKENEKEVTA